MFSFYELFDLILMWLVVSYVFSPKNITTDEFKKIFLLAGGSVVLHELFHKISAIFFGLEAVFHAFYPGLLLSVILKLISPFIIIVPGYVSIYGSVNPLENLIISFAGPFANLILWILFRNIAFKRGSNYFYWASELNKFLFIFNMIPIPPLDGFKVVSSLFALLF